MSLNRQHELHTRRSGRNWGVGLVLVLFVALVFGLTIVKVSNGDQMQGFDHTYRPEIDPANRFPVETGGTD